MKLRDKIIISVCLSLVYTVIHDVYLNGSFYIARRPAPLASATRPASTEYVPPPPAPAPPAEITSETPTPNGIIPSMAYEEADGMLHIREEYCQIKGDVFDGLYMRPEAKVPGNGLGPPSKIKIKLMTYFTDKKYQVMDTLTLSGSNGFHVTLHITEEGGSPGTNLNPTTSSVGYAEISYAKFDQLLQLGQVRFSVAGFNGNLSEEALSSFRDIKKQIEFAILNAHNIKAQVESKQ